MSFLQEELSDAATRVTAKRNTELVRRERAVWSAGGGRTNRSRTIAGET